MAARGTRGMDVAAAVRGTTQFAQTLESMGDLWMVAAGLGLELGYQEFAGCISNEAGDLIVRLPLPPELNRALPRVAHALAAAAAAVPPASAAGGAAVPAAKRALLVLLMALRLYQLARLRLIQLPDDAAGALLQAAALPLSLAPRLLQSCLRFGREAGSAALGILPVIEELQKALLVVSTQSVSELLKWVGPSERGGHLPAAAVAEARRGVLSDGALLGWLASICAAVEGICASGGTQRVPTSVLDVFVFVARSGGSLLGWALRSAPSSQLPVVRLMAKFLNDPQLPEAARSALEAAPSEEGQERLQVQTQPRPVPPARPRWQEDCVERAGQAAQTLSRSSLRHGIRKYDSQAAPGQQLLPSAVRMLQLLPASARGAHAAPALKLSALQLVAELASREAEEAVRQADSSGEPGAASPPPPQLGRTACDALLAALPHLHGAVAAAGACGWQGLAAEWLGTVLGCWTDLCTSLSTTTELPPCQTAADCQAAAAAAEALLRMHPLLPLVPCVPADSSLHTGVYRPSGAALLPERVDVLDIFVGRNRAQVFSLSVSGLAFKLLQSAGAAPSQLAARMAAAASPALWSAALTTLRLLWSAHLSPFSRPGAWSSVGSPQRGRIAVLACLFAQHALQAAGAEGDSEASRHLDCLAVMFCEAAARSPGWEAATAAGEFSPPYQLPLLLDLFKAPGLAPLLRSCGGGGLLLAAAACAMDVQARPESEAGSWTNTCKLLCRAIAADSEAAVAVQTVPTFLPALCARLEAAGREPGGSDEAETAASMLELARLIEAGLRSVHPNLGPAIDRQIESLVAEGRASASLARVQAMLEAVAEHRRAAAAGAAQAQPASSAAGQDAQQPQQQQPPAAVDGEAAVRRARSLALLACGNPRCCRLDGPTEAAAPRGKLCSGCKMVRFCSPECSRQEWRRGAHKTACRLLAAEAQAEASSSG